jgi:hypothetical protein
MTDKTKGLLMVLPFICVITAMVGYIISILILMGGCMLVLKVFGGAALLVTVSILGGRGMALITK